MAMSSAIQWEFRSTATANMVNGGGWKTGATGTDYSTQDAAQWTTTDLTCTAASTTVTSAGSTFTSAVVGNVIHLTALTGTGALVGWYEITAFTDANNIVLDRTPTNGVNNITAGTFYIGGALNIGGSLEDDFFEQLVGTNGSGGQTVWFYNNNTTTTVTFTPSEAISMTKDGGTQAPIIIEGYKTTRGDNPTGGSRPTIAFDANGFVAGDNLDFYNLQFTGTAASMFGLGVNGKAINCKFTNSSSTADRVALNLVGNDGLVLDCEITNYKGRGISHAANSNSNIFGNYVHHCDQGIRANLTSGHVLIANNIFESCITQVILIGANVNVNSIIGNTLYGSENTTGIGIGMATTGTTDLRVINNIIYGFATGVSHVDTA